MPWQHLTVRYAYPEESVFACYEKFFLLFSLKHSLVLLIQTAFVRLLDRFELPHLDLFVYHNEYLHLLSLAVNHHLLLFPYQ